jgi:general secretion pathway protein G
MYYKNQTTMKEYENSDTKSFVSFRDSRRRRHAFTLLEIMVVVVIIGLLASLVTVRTRSYLTVSRQNAAKAEISKIVDALEAFYAIENRYPTNEEGIAVLCAKTPKFPDGLLSKVPQDPWNHDYVYNCPGRTSAYEVICYATDGKEGGENENADIVSGEY